MADAVTSQTLFDGAKRTIMKFTNLSDGTGESAVTKVDVSTLVGAPSLVRIDRIIAQASGMSVTILWDADTDVHAWIVGQDADCDIDLGEVGIKNNAGTGVTGDIKFTTTGHTAGDSYSIILFMSK